MTSSTSDPSGARAEVGSALVHLVDRERRERVGPPEDQVSDRPLGGLELAGVLDRAGGAGLDAEATVHALGHVDVELGDHPLLGLAGSFSELDRDAADGAGALAGLAAGADGGVHLEEAAVARGEDVLDRQVHAVGVLDGDGGAGAPARGSPTSRVQKEVTVSRMLPTYALAVRGMAGGSYQSKRSTRSWAMSETLSRVCLRKRQVT